MNSDRFVKIWAAVVAVALFAVTGCSRINDGKIRSGSAIDALMNNVESIINSDADLADSLMNLIDSNSLRGKERKARYALLYSEAQFKNYQPFTSDSLILTAARYYSISNNLDYRFLSYYYLGCAYMELKQFTDAAVALAQAEMLVNTIDNDYWIGLLYTQLGDLFNESYDYHRAEEYFSKSAHYYELAGKETHKMYALNDIAKCNIDLHDFYRGDSLLKGIEEWAIQNNDTDLYSSILYDRLFCSLFLKDSEISSRGFKDNVTKYKDYFEHIHYLELMALYHNSVKEYALSDSYLQEAWNCKLSAKDSIYLSYVSFLLADSRGQIDKSLEYYRNYISLQNDKLRKVLNQPILGVQKEHYRVFAENEQLKNRHARTTLVLCVLIFMLIIVIVMVTYHYKKKHMQEQLYDSLAVVEELSAINHINTDKIEHLKNEVRRQFRERHDMSNRLYSMYFDSESQDKITKQQLKVTINGLIKDYTAPENVKKLDGLIDESYDGIMTRLSAQDFGLTEKELQLLRFSFAGLSSKSVSVIINETPQNIYQLKSRLLKKVKRNSEELWETLNNIW